jgi:hypothetical protein
MNKTTPTLFSRNIRAGGWRPGCALLAGALLGLLALQNARAQQALPFYEPFSGNYVNGEYLGSYTASGSTSGGTSGIYWNFGNSLSSSCARVESYADLEYPSLVNTDATLQSFGLSSYYKDTGSTKDRGASLTITAGTTVYASCLINVQYYTNTTVFPAPFFGLSPSSASAGSSVSQAGAVVYFNAAGQLMIAKNSTTPATNTTYSLTTSNTHLVVLRYKVNTGSPDEVDLWLDPTSLGNDGNVPAPTITTTNNANIASFGSVAYFQLANPSVFYLDEIRVAYDWAGVTPTTAAPGNIYPVSGGGSGCAGEEFSVNLSGSDSGLTYMLYTNGAFNGQSLTGTGSAIAFNDESATALYTVLATNSVSGGAAWMNGSAAVTVLSLPNIATEPVSATVAASGLAAFSVTSAGSGLNYQWYRNGTALSDGGHLSGSQTATLVISPATTADAATTANGYFVIVANRCGNGVISTTNALILDTPANLLWSGDGNSNFWDVATSTNWNYSNTLGYNTAVFNYGDNATFDDTSANTTVNLNNVNLSPTLTTINGSANTYTFLGSGLAGTGSLLMNSSSTLNLDCVNNETGGIVISNGAVAFGSSSDLGFGPITLAGGTLTPPGNGLVTVTNTIIITTNSATGSVNLIGVNSPGGQPLQLTAPLAGVAGTLTLENITTKNAATAAIEFTATNMTFNLPLDLNIGSGSLEVGGFNTAGSQIWNGVITDAGGMERNAAGGTTVLNNTNNYSGATELASGIIGVGADSDPALDAGPLGTGTLVITASAAAATLEIYASGGAHIIGNLINYSSNLFGSPFIIGGSNNLAFFGDFDLSGTNRVIETDNSGETVFAGDITENGGAFDNGNPLGFTKTGEGVLYLDATNDFTGDLTNSVGTLAGSGIVSGPVVVLSGAAIGGGDAGTVPGTLTLNAGLTLAGNVAIRVNKAEPQSNDVVAVTGTLANMGTGTVTVANVGPALKIGDSFSIFSEPVTGGNALTVSGGGVTWNNQLASNGSISVAAIAPTSPPVFISTVLRGGNLVSAVSNGTAGSTYYVLASTNLALPLTNWTPVSTSTYPSGNFYLTNTVNPATPHVFFRLSPNP